MRGFSFNDDNRIKIQKILAKYPPQRKASAVLPLLDLAQRQLGGSLTKEAVEHIAHMLDMSQVKVQEVASFYSMFYLKPMGKYHIQVCTTTPCWLRGSDNILKACKKATGLEVGQTTKDGKFTLSEVECLGACVNAPLAQINDDYYEDLDEDSIQEIIKRLSQNS